MTLCSFLCSTQMRLIKQVLMMSSPQDHLTNWNHYISTNTVPVTTKRNRVVTKFERLLSIIFFPNSTLWSRDLARSCNELKSLYLHYPSAYSNQTWQDDDLNCAASTPKVTWPYNKVILGDHEKLKSSYIHYHNVYHHQIWQGYDLLW